MSEGQKPTIDERLEALTQNLELFMADLEAERELRREIDARERRGRNAILRAIAAYLEELDGNGEGV